MDIITCLIGLAAIVAFFCWVRGHDPSLPPCPVTPLPFIGHLLYMKGNPRPYFKKWRKQCGDIYSLYMGRALVVVLNGYDLLKEALVTHEDTFSDRPYALYDAGVTGKSGLGLAFSSGDVWEEQRAITVTSFRKLGATTSAMSERISELAAQNNERISQLKGQPVDLSDIITSSTAHIVCFLIFGRCFDHSDEVFVKACLDIKKNVKDSSVGNWANFFPFLVYLPGDMFKLKIIKERANYIVNSFIKVNIQKCRSENIQGHTEDNFITMYSALSNKKRLEGQSTYLDDDNLIKSIHDMFGAAVDTTSNTLLWCILYFLHYPETQEKAYREIERVVGTERPANMSDKSRLPYLNAVIQETQRIASIIPLNLMHMCSKTFRLRGYTIPKGTQIIPSLDSVLYDKTIWGEDVFTFRPERFLDENGKVKHPPELVAFSMGRRFCPGAAIAKMQMFLFMSRMIQRFKFVPSEPGKLPPLTPNFGLTVSPVAYEVRAIERHALN
ncbi:hypothetical protein BsWGS_16188 [Bradybaena similaris]